MLVVGSSSPWLGLQEQQAEAVGWGSVVDTLTTTITSTTTTTTTTTITTVVTHPVIQS